MFFVELPAPSDVTLTFINISSVNISWEFDFSAIVPAQNICFGIEYQNNTIIQNVSSLICKGNSTYYIFPYLLEGRRYIFRVYATNGMIKSPYSDWTFRFANGVEGNYILSA